MTTPHTPRLTRPLYARGPIVLAIGLLLATFTGTPAADAMGVCPAVPIVTATADSGPGSLRQAIVDACATDTITFAPGIGPSIDLTSGELVIDKDLTITGPGAKLLTVQRATSAPFRIFHILPGHEVTIKDVTIANGLATGLWPLKVGGGIYNDGSTLTVERAALSHNAAPDVNGGSGGAIQNSAETAGASLTIVESTLNDNTAGIGGGAVASISGAGFTAFLTISNSTVSGNSGGDTGGLLVDQPDGVSTATITNATITGNHATFPGTRVGGLRAVVGTTVTVHNSIIAGNITDNAPTAIAADVDGRLDSSSANNLVGDGSGMTGIADSSNGNQVGSAGSPIDPRLGLLADNGGPTFTHALLAGSPALDAGKNTLVVGLTDQRGGFFARIVDGAAGDSTPTVDIGAVEANPSI
ncbi:MAG TPA: choice-of-anchor Q domain-containing protein, partial [Vicinamibacterales bacterium]|nr:choice-of-anchor Q domain-containing protein [Vicinamibacterales bacterium]